MFDKLTKSSEDKSSPRISVLKPKLNKSIKNEKYKGDALLQKTYTVDYLTKTVAKNKGQVAQYYVENSHQGIVSREIFDMVQEEIKRRKNHTGYKTTSYSSQYALTGIVYCGECGANYRRVTWARNGIKRIVWRCIERLESGTQNWITLYVKPNIKIVKGDGSLKNPWVGE